MLPIGESEKTFEAFVEKINKELNKIDTNKQLPTEHELRCLIAKILQEEIDKKTNKTMIEIIINLERELIDIVLFYYPKNKDEKPFAEMIELKRGGKDRKFTEEKEEKISIQELADYFNEPKEQTTAEDIKKIIEKIAADEGVGRANATWDYTDKVGVPIRSGITILLCPNEKKNENQNWISRKHREKIGRLAKRFWNGKVGRILIQQMGGAKIQLTQQTFNDVGVMEQERQEFLVCILIKKKD